MNWVPIIVLTIGAMVSLILNLNPYSYIDSTNVEKTLQIRSLRVKLRIVSIVIILLILIFVPIWLSLNNDQPREMSVYIQSVHIVNDPFEATVRLVVQDPPDPSDIVMERAVFLNGTNHLTHTFEEDILLEPSVYENIKLSLAEPLGPNQYYLEITIRSADVILVERMPFSV